MSQIHDYVFYDNNSRNYSSSHVPDRRHGAYVGEKRNVNRARSSPLDLLKKRKVSQEVNEAEFVKEAHDDKPNVIGAPFLKYVSMVHMAEQKHKKLFMDLHFEEKEVRDPQTDRFESLCVGII